MVDKYLVKKYVADKIGEEYIIPTLGVWDSPEEIDFDKLPDKFVLKCNHNSGIGLCICRNKKELNISRVKKELAKGLSQDYYHERREWPYKDVIRRIIAEKYMEDNEDNELRDYKFFCFDGVVKALFIGTERQNRKEPYFDFFDENFNHLDIINGHPNAPVIPHKPKCFEEMKRLASVLSKGIPHVRVDLYEVNGKVYFGELTFSHWSGMVSFVPEEWNYRFGDWIVLPHNIE